MATRWFTPILTALVLVSPLACAAQESASDFSWLRLIPSGFYLDSWSFDLTNLDSDFGFAPLRATNVEQVPDWDGEALVVDSTNAARLIYGILQNAPGYGVYTNLCLNSGTIEFCFAPDWKSDDTNFYGAGPGAWGRFIDVGARRTNGGGWWSLYLNSSGTSVYFSSGTNGIRTNYLNAPISWNSGAWHVLALTYGPTDSLIYLDGQLAASGDGVRYVPNGGILTNGFAIGSDFDTGMQQAHGQFDDLVTYNYQLNARQIADDYADVHPELPGTLHLMDDEAGPPLPPGGTNDDGDGGYGGGGDETVQNYGTNLCLALEGMTNDTLSLLATNTQPDIFYEIQQTTKLLAGWNHYAFIYGSELTNWTPASAPVGTNGQTFYRIRSWQGVDGIPFWWFLAYLGQDTNVSGEMFSPSGDGWTLLQCWEEGINPTNFVQPPAPQGLTITSFNATNNTATLSWMLSAGPALGYNVQTSNGTNVVGSGVNSYTDNSSSPSATYSIQAIYSGGDSAWSPSVSVEDFENQSTNTSPETANNTLSASIIAGPLGTAYLAVSIMPANTTGLEVSRIDEIATYAFGDDSFNTNFYIPITSPTNGFYPIPNTLTPPDAYVQDLQEYGYFASEEDWYAQAIETNGQQSEPVPVGSGFTISEDETNTWTVAPYFDGRVQMKQNVVFQLRSAQADTPFKFSEPYSGYPRTLSVAFPTNYVYSGFYRYDAYNNGIYDNLLPFEDNYTYSNFVFNDADLDSSGVLNTVTNGNLWPNLNLARQPTYELQLPETVTNQAAIPAVLDASDTRWLSVGLDAVWETDPFVFSTYDEIGLQFNYDGNNLGTWTMETNPANLYGLPFLSNEGAWGDASAQTALLDPGDSLTTNYAFFYSEVEPPQFQVVGFDFWSPTNSILPGDPNFATTNMSAPVLVAGVGQETSPIAAYEKLAVVNGASNVYAYVGQYFTNAYEIDGDGNVTTNPAGVLSPYGQFFATEPGQAALVTMPDPDTGQQGTDSVDAIALNVDANRDGTMDFSFAGPDFTSAENPYRFWVDDSQDAGDEVGTGVPEQGTEGNGAVTINGQYVIHGRRDLVNFFPVYVNIGSLFQSNALSAGIRYTETNYQYVLSQAQGALRFAYTDLTPTNYMNYFRDINESGALVYYPGDSSYPALTTVSNTGVALSRSFLDDIATNNGGIILVEGWEATTRPLVLTIYHGTNQIAQTSLYLSISEVEQMFRQKSILVYPDPNQQPDRLTDADVPNEPPTNDKNFVFLHGYNVNPDQARGVAADMFKRLFWSGSHARFWNVVWTGYDSQILDATTINYHTNEVHACASAPALTNFLATLTNGPIIVAAHSLGNMVVLSALNDYGERNISTYFMIDAAIPMEAIQGNATPGSHLYYPDWFSYADRLNASHWASLWPATDGRSELTWSNRFANLQNADVYNFYSSGEEVLREYTDGYPPSELEGAADQVIYYLENELQISGSPVGSYVWAWQTLLKGRGEYDGLLGSTHGGWKFNTNAPYAYVTNGVVTQIPNSQAELIPDSQLQTNAFFEVTSPQFGNADLALFGSSGSRYAEANRNRILSDAIPELTLPVGVNPVTGAGIVVQNFDMQGQLENGWSPDRPIRTTGAIAAGEWHHSDFHQMAYTFTYHLFDELVTLGNLK